MDSPNHGENDDKKQEIEGKQIDEDQNANHEKHDEDINKENQTPVLEQQLITDSHNNFDNK